MDQKSLSFFHLFLWGGSEILSMIVVVVYFFDLYYFGVGRSVLDQSLILESA